MKAKRRQELKTNDLAQQLEDLRKFISNYGNYLLGGLVVIVVIVVGARMYTGSRSKAVETGWGKIESASVAAAADVRGSVETLKGVAADTGDPMLQSTALLRAADLCYGSAVTFRTGPIDQERVNNAEDLYKRVLREHADNLIAAASSYAGLAAISETRFALTGDMTHKEQARQYWAKLRDDERFNVWPQKAIALEKLNTLDERLAPVALVEAPPPPPLPIALELAEEQAKTETPTVGAPEAAAVEQTPGAVSDEAPTEQE